MSEFEPVPGPASVSPAEPPPAPNLDNTYVAAALMTGAAYFSNVLSRRERIKQRLRWPYWRQTRLIEPVRSWWVNRGH